MNAVWMRARHDLRRRWRGALLLAVLLGLVGGVAVTAAAGARRTTTSYQRLLRAQDAYDVEVQIAGDAEPAVLDRVAALPQVTDHGRITFIPATEANRDGRAEPFSWDVSSVALVDPSITRSLEIPIITKGRLASADAPLEAMANARFMRSHQLEVGDTFSIQTATFDEVFELFAGGHPIPTGPVVPLRIVGVIRIPHDTAINEPEGILTMTPAFFTTYSERIAHLWGMFVRLRHGTADVASFLDAAKTIAAEAGVGDDVAEEEVLSFRSNIESSGSVNRALAVQAVALWIFTGVLGGAGVLVLGQALGRWQAVSAEDHGVLRSLGMSRRGLTQTVALPSTIVAIGAGLIAAVTAYLLSPLVPIGFARGIEPHLGFFVDAAALLVGGLGLVIAITLWAFLHAAFIARRAHRRVATTTTRPSALVGFAARWGMPAPLVAGLRFGLEPGTGRRAVPIRSVLAGTTLAMLVVTGAFVFGRSLERMFATPASYGWNFDLVLAGGDDEEGFVAEREKALVASPRVGELSRVSIGTTTFQRRDLETLGVASLRGTITPTILDGRFPRAADEVALASRTMREAEVGIGDRFTLPGSPDACGGAVECDVTFKVVGTIIHWGEGSDTDDGASFTAEGQSRVRRSEGFTDFVLRVPRGSDRDRTVAALEQEFGDAMAPRLSTNLRNVERVRGVPTLLSAMLGGLALVTLIHALLMTARRRRYDLAVLKTLGFVRRQVTSAVAWQATTLALLALAIGVPLGIVAGRWTWTALAGRLGVADIHALAPLWLLAGIAVVVALANAIALVPGRSAARTQAALVLRTE